MRKLTVALVAGAAVTLFTLLLGVDQPGRWLAQIGGRPMRGYDIYIHDRYFIIQPVVLLVNVVVFTAATLAIMRLARRAASGREGRSAGA